jgi:leucyl aminopeptidase
MNTTYTTEQAATLGGDTLILLSFEDAIARAGSAGADEAIAGLHASGEFKGKALDTAVLHGPVGLGYRRIVLVGGGKKEGFSAPALRKAVSVAVRVAKSKAAREAVLECEILDEPGMRHLGMGALLGVAQGSAEPPALIVLKYTPRKPGPDCPDHLGLVGKGVTFDTGGVSIKPSEGMEKMKYDMSGARRSWARCARWRS